MQTSHFLQKHVDKALSLALEKFLQNSLDEKCFEWLCDSKLLSSACKSWQTEASKHCLKVSDVERENPFRIFGERQKHNFLPKRLPKNKPQQRFHEKIVRRSQLITIENNLCKPVNCLVFDGETDNTAATMKFFYCEVSKNIPLELDIEPFETCFVAENSE